MKCIRFSEAVSLALHTMVLIASNPQTRWTTREIAVTLGVSANHLSKVHTRLVNHGLLSSTRGPKGGLSLGREPDKISLLEVYELIEGQIPEHSCLLGKPVCNRSCCQFGDLLSNINAQVKEYFRKTRLSDFTDQENRC